MARDELEIIELSDRRESRREPGELEIIEFDENQRRREDELEVEEFRR
jgi:hypothetical protein